MADWVMDPEGEHKSLSQLVETHTPYASNWNMTKMKNSPRCCIDAIYLQILGVFFESRLKADQLYSHFDKTETVFLNCITKMEMAGFPFSPRLFEKNSQAFDVSFTVFGWFKF